MASTRRTTVYFDDTLHRALRLRAVETDRSISDLVNEAVRDRMTQDAGDLRVFRDREAEPTVSFEEFVSDLTRRGQL
jgi:hypothetical protein